MDRRPPRWATSPAAASPTVQAAALGIAIGWNVANTGAVASDLAASYGVGLTVIGLFTTALFIVHSAVQLPSGQITDRIGSAQAVFAALIVIVAANALALIAHEPALAIATRAIAGIGTGLGVVAGIEHIRATGGGAFGQGLFGGAISAGGGGALALVPALYGPFGWRSPYYTAVATALIGLLALVGRGQPAARPARATRPSLASVVAVSRDSSLYSLALVHVCTFGLSLVAANWIATLLRDERGYSRSAAGEVGALMLVFGIVSRPLGGWLLTRYPGAARTIVGASVVIGAAGMLVVGLGASRPLTALAATAVGLAAGLPLATVMVRAASAHPAAPATSVGFVNMLGNAIVFAGTPLLGLGFSAIGGGTSFVVVAALWAMALAAVPGLRTARSQTAV